MKQRLLCTLLVSCLAVSDRVSAAETATLRMVFRLQAAPPPSQPIVPSVDRVACGAVEIPNERLIVNPANRGVQNIVVSVYTGRRKTTLADDAEGSGGPKTQTHRLVMKDCRFQPHILIARKGDTLRVVTEDAVGHNANFSFFNNYQRSNTIPVGSSYNIQLKDSEPAPVPVQCNIHPWMSAYVLVLAHRLAAISDADGFLELDGLPVGENIVFRVFHEGMDLTSPLVNGEAETWRLSKFQRTLRRGSNPIESVEIPVSAFKDDKQTSGD